MVCGNNLGPDFVLLCHYDWFGSLLVRGVEINTVNADFCGFNFRINRSMCDFILVVNILREPLILKACSHSFPVSNASLLDTFLPFFSEKDCRENVLGLPPYWVKEFGAFKPDFN